MSNLDPIASDPYLNEMIRARNAPATAKTELATLRSTFPTAIIFCLEGIDDKPAYFHWCAKLNHKLRYETFLCNGKSVALALKKSLEDDLGNLRDGVYIFIDRDFDDLRGSTPANFVFMTNRYSIENYYVDPAVVEEFLRNEFHISIPEVRAKAMQAFEDAYTSFLNSTRDLNFRIYLARILKIGMADNITTKINKLAAINLSCCSKTSDKIEEIIPLKREATAEEVACLWPEFKKLDERERYRGKFALAFFQRWLSLILKDFSAESSNIFGQIEDKFKIKGEIGEINRIACKAPIPSGLAEFIASVRAPSLST